MSRRTWNWILLVLLTAMAVATAPVWSFSNGYKTFATMCVLWVLTAARLVARYFYE